MTKQSKMKYTINILFYLYFLLLFIERMVSVILSIQNNVDILGDAFNLVVYLTIFISLLSFLVYLAIFCRDSRKALFSPKDELLDAIQFKRLCIASGIILFSGMVHSEYTISPLQFASYGLLIFGIILWVVLNFQNAKDKGVLLFSLVYLICFSMTIPVTYRTGLSYHTAFHIFSFVTTYLLVILFTILLVWIFDNKENLFNIPFFLTMVILG